LKLDKPKFEQFQAVICPNIDLEVTCIATLTTIPN